MTPRPPLERRLGRAGWLLVVVVLVMAGAGVALLPKHLGRERPAPMVMPPALQIVQPGLAGALSQGVDFAPGSQPLSWTAAGRWRAAGAGLDHEWPGLVLGARFAGDGVQLAFDDPLNRYRLTVDGAEAAQITRPGQAVVRLSGFGDGPHDLRLERLSEAWAPARIAGLAVPAGGAVLDPPPPPARRIDVYGDSDSLGYGIEHKGRTCLGETVFLTTDATQAWPMRLARQFGAGLSMVSRSGIGLVRNYGGAAPGRAMATLRDRLLPSDPAPADLPAPWLTLIALGDNDVSTELTAGEAWPDMPALMADFTATLERMIRDLLARAPGHPILIVAYRDAGKPLHGRLEEVAAKLAAEGAPVWLVSLPRLDRLACDWHPSLADHAMMGETLIHTVDAMIADGRLEAP